MKVTKSEKLVSAFKKVKEMSDIILSIENDSNGLIYIMDKTSNIYPLFEASSIDEAKEYIKALNEFRFSEMIKEDYEFNYSLIEDTFVSENLAKGKKIKKDTGYTFGYER